jgi:hypothetical protein
MEIANSCFENVAQYKYLRTAVTNQYLIHLDIKRRLISGNVSYHSVQNLSSTSLLHNIIKFKIYKTIAKTNVKGEINSCIIDRKLYVNMIECSNATGCLNISLCLSRFCLEKYCITPMFHRCSARTT